MAFYTREAGPSGRLGVMTSGSQAFCPLSWCLLANTSTYPAIREKEAQLRVQISEDTRWKKIEYRIIYIWDPIYKKKKTYSYGCTCMCSFREMQKALMVASSGDKECVWV